MTQKYCSMPYMNKMFSYMIQQMRELSSSILKINIQSIDVV